MRFWFSEMSAVTLGSSVEWWRGGRAGDCCSGAFPLLPNHYHHTLTPAHTHTHARTHPRAHAQLHAHTHARTHTHTPRACHVVSDGPPRREKSQKKQTPQSTAKKIPKKPAKILQHSLKNRPAWGWKRARGGPRTGGRTRPNLGARPCRPSKAPRRPVGVA